MLKSFTVTVKSLDYENKNKKGTEKNYAIITFTASRADVSMEIPIPVSTDLFDEAEYIRIARGLLHFMISDLAEELQGWALSPEERKTIGLPDPTHPPKRVASKAE